jgi:hypothetical protein
MSAFQTTLANEYAYATECALATLSGLVCKKSTAKSEIRRQRSICLRQLGICQTFKSEIEWGTQFHPNFGRAQKLVAETDLGTALDGWIDRQKPGNTVSVSDPV